MIRPAGSYRVRKRVQEHVQGYEVGACSNNPTTTWDITRDYTKIIQSLVVQECVRGAVKRHLLVVQSSLDFTPRLPSRAGDDDIIQ